MPAVSGSEHVSTEQLLAVIARHGKSWPAAMAEYSIETLSVAVGREITSRNLIDGATLSERGRQRLEAVDGPDPVGRLEVRRDEACTSQGGRCRRDACPECGQALHEHMPGPQLDDAVADALADHLCLPEPDVELPAGAAGESPPPAERGTWLQRRRPPVPS